MNKVYYWVWLTLALGFSASAGNKVLYKFTPEAAYKASKDELLFAGLGEKIADKLSDKSLDRSARIIELCEKKGIKIICASSPEYPRALERLDDKPMVLYVRGDISCINGRKTSAFIGTRRMTQRGRENAVRIADDLLDDGNLLISGIAEGIDAIASKQSLARGVATVAVMGVDIDKYFPVINKDIIDKIAETGAVISEYPPETNARYFATRNRIIVGLSDKVNVIEADANSGALIGARLALKKGIPTYALVLEGDNFAGCRMLVAEGATALDGSDAVIKREKKTKSIPKTKSFEIPDEITGARRYILERLVISPQDDNSLMCKEFSVSEILCGLTELELDGYVKLLPNGKYALK